MATSGTVLFNMSAGDLVRSAFSKIGVKAAEQELQPFEMQDGLIVLNLLIKSWQAYNAHLWATTEGVVFLNLHQAKYFLGPGGDNATLTTDFISTTLTADAAAAATTLTVESTVGMSVNDFIGVQLSNNVRQWSTVVSISSLTQLTIADPLASATQSSNSIFTYTDKLVRPLRLLAARRKYFDQPSEIDMQEYSEQQYFAQVNKNQNGIPNAYYYKPTLNNGELYIWQPTSSVDQYVLFTFYSPLQDVGTQANTVYFPQEWLQGIIYNIAMLLCEDYNVPASKEEMVTKKAVAFFENVIQFDEEMTSLNIQPDGGY